MKGMMDANFLKAKVEMTKAKLTKDTDSLWKLWSEAVGEAYIKFLELTPKEEKKMRGRGSVKIVEKEPLPRGNEDRRIRNVWSYKARRCLQQARRAEQLAYRMMMLIDEDEIKGPISEEAMKEWEEYSKNPKTKGREYIEKEEVQTTYGKLNKEAMKLLKKNIDKEIKWEVDFGISMR